VRRRRGTEVSVTNREAVIRKQVKKQAEVRRNPAEGCAGSGGLRPQSYVSSSPPGGSS
jgi:hypothetical protein